MGKRLIIKGADFSANAITTSYIKLTIAPGGSVDMQYLNGSTQLTVFKTYQNDDEINDKEVFVDEIDLRSYSLLTGSTWFCNQMFLHQSDLKSIEVYDGYGYITSIGEMCEDCQALTMVSFLKLNSKIKLANYIVESSPAGVSGLENIDVSECTSFSNMLKSCQSHFLSINGWDMRAGVNFSQMFGYTTLREIDLSNTKLPATESAKYPGQTGANSFIFNGSLSLRKLYLDNVSPDDKNYWEKWVVSAVGGTWEERTEDGRLVYAK